MSDLRTAAQQALEALEADCCGGCDAEYNPCRQRRLAESLRAALAQQAEPLNLSDPAIQKRLASQWGYVPAAAQAEPVEPVAQFDLNTMPGQADAHLRALLRYTENFYATAIEHGMRAGPTANAIAHVERAGKALHQIVHAQAKMLEPARPVEPVEPVAWKQGNLVTFNEDPYPALGGLFVQFWDGEEVAARVYANDPETLRQRCAKVNTAPPQPLTEEEIVHIGMTHQSLRQVVRAVERAHGIKE